ncbi:clostripain-related cysteine peptidase (plasmid) [Deinococcus sp. KNUC1210]|uniref:clostripain-related cysteine peptidase n=1 Tax=Deinococcus sp. KNUC1210 TaxID=2917691 RepID=UPI001EEFEF36|nr:clostripain-related cysteine peptidase [Deinococcus sp. KNUC1210]ULH17038.1 clostripain-related cysteine peptidase [Deinococcus sp. KNUC1210]
MKPLSLLSLCSALFLGTTQAAPAQPRPWTVAVYLDADHNLDSSALDDLKEMTEAGPLKNVRVVYQLDRNDDAEGAGPGVERGLIENGKRVPVQRLPELNSDNPQNVAAFMTWAYSAYPSAHHGLVMWDHGGQWDGGFGGDTHGPGVSDDESGTLTPEAFSQAAQRALKGLGIAQLDFLGFDTCLMGGAELVAQFAPLTRLYIADAEIDYGDGWNYAPTLQALDRTPEQPMKTFGAQEVRFWEAQHRSNRSDQLYGVHAAYDTSMWPDVQAKLGSFAQGLTKAFATPAAAGLLWRARGEAIQYDFSDDGQPGVTRPYVDLGQFAGKVAQYTQDPALKAQASALSTSIARMVVAKSVGKKRTAASALSIYYPTHQETIPDTDTLNRYAALPMNAGAAWSNFERAWTAAVRADTSPPLLKNVQMAGVNKDGSAQFEFTAGGADVYAAMASLYQDLGHDQYLDYGDVYYTRLVGGDYSFDWMPTTWSLSDGTHTTAVTADHGEPDDEFLTASAQYTPPGEDPFDVLVQFSEDGEVIGALDDSGDTPIGIDLEKGGTLRFYLRTYDGGKDTYGRQLQKSVLKITRDDLSNLKADLVDLPAGNFQMYFSVYDFAGNNASDFAEFSFN